MKSKLLKLLKAIMQVLDLLADLFYIVVALMCIIWTINNVVSWAAVIFVATFVLMTWSFYKYLD